MSGLLVTVGLIVALAAVVMFALDRTLKRAEEQRRLREWAATSPELARMAERWRVFSQQVGEGELSAAQRMAASMAAFTAAANKRDSETTP